MNDPTSKHKRIRIVTDVGNDGVCEMCGVVAELRPYGPNGESICYDCGMKDVETTKKQFHKTLE